MSQWIQSLLIGIVSISCLLFSSLAYGQPSELIRLPMHQQTLDANTLFQALAPDLHWTAAAAATLQQEFFANDNQSPRSAAILDRQQIEKYCQTFPEIFSLNSKDGREELVVDRGNLQKLLREQKLKLRRQLAQVAGIETTKLSKLPTTWTATDQPPSRVVIVLHGIHSTPAAGMKVADDLHQATGLPMSLFLYPNDAPVIESAEELVNELKTFAADFPETKISLVAYSLGGLVARAALEWPTLKGNPALHQIDQVILVSPPNHGSALWEYAPLLEGAEVWQRIMNHESLGRPLQRIAGAISDGLNEASADLDPKSEWLLELNRQPRRPGVEYTILYGDRGPIRPVAGLLIQVGLNQLEQNVDLGPLAQRLAAVTRMTELHYGKGDGVVRIPATKLEGVADWERLPISHLDWGRIETEAGRTINAAIAKRLSNR